MSYRLRELPENVCELIQNGLSSVPNFKGRVSRNSSEFKLDGFRNGEFLQLTAPTWQDIDDVVRYWIEDIERFYNLPRIDNGTAVRVIRKVAEVSGINPNETFVVMNCEYPLYDIQTSRSDSAVIRVHEKYLATE